MPTIENPFVRKGAIIDRPSHCCPLRSQFLGMACLCLLFATLCATLCGPFVTVLSAQARPSSAPGFAVLSAKANAARDSDQLDQAVALYKRALLLRPQWTEGWWSLGTIQYDRNHYTDAAREFQKVVQQAPQQGTARLMFGLCEFELGNDKVALQAIEKAKGQMLANDPQLRHVLLYHDGILLRRAGRFEGAQESLGELCAENVQSKESVQEQGMVALRIRAKGPVTGPDAEVVQQVGQASCLSAQKKFADARQLFSSIVQAHPDFPEIHYAYGKFLLDASDTPAAIEQFQEEIKQNPKDILARLQIAAAEYRADSASGVPYAEEAVALAPQLPFAHYLLGLLLLDIGNFQKAIPQLETAEHAFPQEAKLYFALSSAYAGAGRMQDAAHARAKFAQLQKEQANRPQMEGATAAPPSASQQTLGREVGTPGPQ
jgi:tetratricopeptide (TPR) repeat protein